MASIKRFEDLEVWKNGFELSVRIYTLTNNSGFSKDFPLRDQARRAAISIISNIAEGFESQTDKCFSRFLGIAKASAGELRAQLYIALAQQYVTEQEFEETCSRCRTISSQCARFIAYLNKDQG